MKVRNFLVIMTLVAVVSDYLLHPFYPHFFRSQFGITDPKAVGFYFSTVCATVMVAFPMWAWISRGRAELRILVCTQLIAGILAASCFFITSYVHFWIVSLSIIVFKGSYLLVYPFILRITKKEEHTSIIGLLSVIIHCGSVLGAVFGGMLIDWFSPAWIFLGMAAGDLIQAGMSFYLLQTEGEVPPAEAKEKITTSFWPEGMVLKIGIITMILYFSDFIIRPFFVRYWESLTATDSRLLSGTVYAIPAGVAMIGLYVNKRRNGPRNVYQGIISALLFGLAGLLLQGYPWPGAVLIGRCIYGWSFFQAAVRFDALLFHVSDPVAYAIEYSKIHFFQNMGVLIASTMAGVLVDQFSLRMPFIVAFSGFAVVTAMYYYVIRTQAGKPALAHHEK
jgi:MFS family permease